MLTVYTLEDSEQWDNIVKSFKEYDVYWLSGYVKAFQIHGDGEPMLFSYNDNSTRGINVVMKRDVADDLIFRDRLLKRQFYDFSTPYGYGGWIVEGENFKGLSHAYESWIEKNGIISEFVRFHPMLQNQKWCNDFYDVIPLGKVVHMDLSCPKTIWENMTSKNRGHIRKAIKSGVVVYNGRYPEIYERFQQIYEETMDKDVADTYYYFNNDFYESVLNDLPENAQVFYAELDKKIIAATIILTTNCRMNYHLSGSLQEYSSLCATNLLLYKVALWGCANGYKTLYLGGGLGSSEDSLFKFKRSFYKGDLNRFFIGKRIYDLSKYEELVSMRNGIESSFFPLYRALA